MLFAEVVGQQALKAKLVELVKAKHLPHAILLLGKEGAGGLPMALALATYIQCEQKGDQDACGECSACIKMEKLQHPDVHFSYPTIKISDQENPPVSADFIVQFREFVKETPYADAQTWIKHLGAEKQGNITALECREIIRKLNLRSFESEFKILIMWYPEYLGKEGNILLKMIEEPTAKTILIFVAFNPDQLLATIQSRCQLFPLRNLQLPEIQEALQNRGVSEQQAHYLAGISEGNFDLALQQIQDNEDDVMVRLRNWLNALYTNKGIEIVDWVNQLAGESRETQKNFLKYTIQLLEHLLRFQYLGVERTPLLANEQKIIETLLAKGLSAHATSELAEELNRSIYELERNANSKILFHSLSLRVQQLLLSKKALVAKA
jgi:DNA polymerase-3 subunit delta'